MRCVLDALGLIRCNGRPGGGYIIHTNWQGDVAIDSKVTDATLQNFGGRSPEKVLS